MNFQRLTFGLLLTLALTFLVQGSALAAKKTAPAEVAVEETVLRGEVKLVSSANKFNRTYFKLNEYPVLIFVEETTEFANPFYAASGYHAGNRRVDRRQGCRG